MSETATLTLADFLLARIAEDEAAAREAADACPDWVWVSHALDSDIGVEAYDFVGRFDATRALAECEAKRRIVALEEQDALGDVGRAIYGTRNSRILRLLALPYADHPDYRDEWKP